MAGRDAHLTVLVPVRNAEPTLADWLDRVGTYADAVIALDDGSTDATRSILLGHPLVTRVLTNPVRDTYEGWDDLKNRQRLVHAALADDARWLLFLDADERLPADDAAALQGFLGVEAQPGYAYGFEVFRMVDDETQFDPRAYWVFRLFSAVDATTPLGSSRLHFVPVPTGIPRNRWLYTTLRIQHFGSLTLQHRQTRYRKYQEADPNRENQASYEELLQSPAMVAAWPARPAMRPVLVGAAGRYADQMSSQTLDHPAVSAVVIAQNDQAVISRSLDALVSQDVADCYEMIVVCSGHDQTADIVRTNYPSVRLVELPEPALPGEARNAGLLMANGDYITFPGSHVWLAPGSLESRVKAHDDGWDLVTVSVANGNTTRAGWASYFLDHAAQTPSHPSGEYFGVPGHVSYVTQQLRNIGGFPPDMRTGEDTVANKRLHDQGRRSYYCSESIFFHSSPSQSAAHLLRHHFQRGRGLGTIIKANRRRATLQQLRANLDLPRRRMRYIKAALAAASDDELHEYRRARHLVTAGALSASVGAWYEMLRPTPQQTSATTDTPIDEAGPLLIIGGRAGEAPTGLLAAGSAQQAAQRLATFTRYARHTCPVRPALAPIATSATITAEQHGTHTIDEPTELIDDYLDAARTVRAELFLQLQPGTATLDTLIDRWEHYLTHQDVGLLFDLRPLVSFSNQLDQLPTIVERLTADHPQTPIAVIGADKPPRGVIPIGAIIDLRQAEGRYPHDALRAAPLAAGLLYQ